MTAQGRRKATYRLKRVKNSKANRKIAGGPRPARTRAATNGGAGARRSTARCFRAVGRAGGGFGVAIGVVEAVGGQWDVAECVEDRTQSGGGVAEDVTLRRGLRAMNVKKRTERAAELCAALGHPIRILLMHKLLEGPSNYRSLQIYTGLGAGPLYHHLNQLRSAKLILPKRRDEYALTKGGRNMFLIAAAAVTLGADERPREAATGKQKVVIQKPKRKKAGTKSTTKGR